MQDHAAAKPFECVECHERLSYEDAAGWHAYTRGDPDMDDDEEIVTYYPGCPRRARAVSPEKGA
jgi:hypothetical protein